MDCERRFCAHFSYFFLQLIKRPIKIHFSPVINCICEQCRVCRWGKRKEEKNWQRSEENCVYANDGHLWKRRGCAKGWRRSGMLQQSIRSSHRLLRPPLATYEEIFWFSKISSLAYRRSMMKCKSAENRFIIRWKISMQLHREVSRLSLLNTSIIPPHRKASAHANEKA